MFVGDEQISNLVRTSSVDALPKQQQQEKSELQYLVESRLVLLSQYLIIMSICLFLILLLWHSLKEYIKKGAFSEHLEAMNGNQSNVQINEA